ncbi:MAG: DUF3040 domain-containing protein [Arachnia sp.]
MALSEQERKLLEQLEASLAADDPKLAENLRGTTTLKVQRRRATLAGLGFIVGLIVLVSGVQLHPAISVLGFLVMLVSAIVGINSWQSVGEDDSGQRTNPSPRTTPPSSTSSDFMERLEERWRRRQDGGD